MSDLNDKDDLLNYDEDIDDKYLDEDELLLLSDEETVPTKLTSKQEELLLLEESEEWVEQRLQTTTVPTLPPTEPNNEEATSSTTSVEHKLETVDVTLPTSTVSESLKPKSPAKKVSPKLRTSPRIKSAATPRKQLKRDGVVASKADVVEKSNDVLLDPVESTAPTPAPGPQTNAENHKFNDELSQNTEKCSHTAVGVEQQPDQIAVVSPPKSTDTEECRTSEVEANQTEQSVEPETDKEATSVSNDESFEVAASELSTPDTARKTRIVHTDSTSEDVLELDYRHQEGDIDELEDKSGQDEPRKPKTETNATTPSVPSTSDISESATTEDDFYKSSPEGQQPPYGGPHRPYGVPYYQHQNDGGFSGSQQHGYGHVPGVRPLGPGQYGQDYRHNYRGQFSGPQFGRPGPRPDFNNHNRPGMMRPMMRPGGWDGPPQRFMERGGFDPRMRMPMGPGQNAGPYRPPTYQPMPLNGGGGGGGPPMRMRPPMQPQMGGPPRPSMMMTPGPPIGIMPRKVLINPNFKGGVEAATNQLMKDTLSSQPQFMQNRALSDEELRRQAEEFINKNMAHVGKRRYERSPSPPPRHRSPRSRSRSYSPPRRRAYSRERDSVGGRRGGRAPYRSRRDGGDDVPFSKRRRSTEPVHDSNKSPDENEDEETRAYRLKIESQKAEREKILREKERRRKEAAEERLKDLQKADELEQAKKLTPLVVTEKKIISLKKRPAEAGHSDSDTTKTSEPDKVKSSPVAKVGSDAKREERKVSTSPAVTKHKNPHNLTDEELQLEMQLLNEEDMQDDLGPHTPPPPVPKVEPPAPVFANRRVVLKLSSAATTTAAHTTTTTTSSSTTGAAKTKAGIFDRLDRKKMGIGMNEVDKRKIQRIVINKAE